MFIVYHLETLSWTSNMTYFHRKHFWAATPDLLTAPLKLSHLCNSSVFLSLLVFVLVLQCYIVPDVASHADISACLSSWTPAPMPVCLPPQPLSSPAVYEPSEASFCRHRQALPICHSLHLPFCSVLPYCCSLRLFISFFTSFFHFSWHSKHIYTASHLIPLVHTSAQLALPTGSTNLGFTVLPKDIYDMRSWESNHWSHDWWMLDLLRPSVGSTTYWSLGLITAVWQYVATNQLHFISPPSYSICFFYKSKWMSTSRLT